MLLRRQPADKPDDRLAVRRPVLPQRLIACRRRVTNHVDPACPLMHPRNTVSNKGFHRRAGWRQGAVGEAVQVAEPRPGRPLGDPDPVASRETRYVGLVYRDRRHPETTGRPHARPSRAAPATPNALRRVESAQHPRHPRRGHPERQRGHLREHPRRRPVHPDTVVDPIGGRLARRGVGRDDKGFMTGAAQVLEHPDHRVADAVDVREKGLRDNRYSHTITVSASPVDMVTDGHTSTRTLMQRGLDNAVLPAGICGRGAVVSDVQHGQRARRRATHHRRQRGDGRVWRCPSAVGDLLRTAMPALRGVGVDVRRPACRRSWPAADSRSRIAG